MSRLTEHLPTAWTRCGASQGNEMRVVSHTCLRPPRLKVLVKERKSKVLLIDPRLFSPPFIGRRDILSMMIVSSPDVVELMLLSKRSSSTKYSRRLTTPVLEDRAENIDLHL